MTVDEILDTRKAPQPDPGTWKSLNIYNCWALLLLVCILIFQRPEEADGIFYKLELRLKPGRVNLDVPFKKQPAPGCCNSLPSDHRSHLTRQVNCCKQLRRSEMVTRNTEIPDPLLCS